MESIGCVQPIKYRRDREDAEPDGYRVPINYDKRQHKGEKGSRLDLAFATSNFPEDYLPYTSTYKSKGSNYIASGWEIYGDAGDHHHHHHNYHSSDDDSNSPANLNYHSLGYHHHHRHPSQSSVVAAASHQHLYPIVYSSSGSWSSSKSRKYCCCSLSCCAIAITALIIITALATVVGVSIYLGMLTSMHKSQLLSVSGRFRVTSGDDFTIKLLNTSSAEYASKVAKYETILKSAFDVNKRNDSLVVENAIVKHEVYAFRKGSLIVFYRVYLDHKKANEILEESARDRDDFEEVLIGRLVQGSLQKGLSQLKITGKEPIVIDPKSVYVTNEFDALMDYDATDIKAAGVRSLGQGPKTMLSSTTVKPSTRRDGDGKSTGTSEAPKTTVPTATSSPAAPKLSTPPGSTSTRSREVSKIKIAEVSEPVSLRTSTATPRSATGSTAPSITTRSSSPASIFIPNIFTVTRASGVASKKPLSNSHDKSNTAHTSVAPPTRRHSRPTPAAPISSSTTLQPLTTKRRRISHAPPKPTPRSTTALPPISTKSPMQRGPQHPNQVLPPPIALKPHIAPNQVNVSPQLIVTKKPNLNNPEPIRPVDPHIRRNDMIKPEPPPRFSSVDFGQWRPVSSLKPPPNPPRPVILRPPPPGAVIGPLPPKPPPALTISNNHNPSAPNRNAVFGLRTPIAPRPIAVNIQQHPRLMDSSSPIVNMPANAREDDDSDKENKEESLPSSSSTTTTTTTIATSSQISSTTASPSTTSSTSASTVGLTLRNKPAMVDGFIVPVFESLRTQRKNKTRNTPESRTRAETFEVAFDDDIGVPVFPSDERILADLRKLAPDRIHKLQDGKPPRGELSVGSPILHLNKPRFNKTHKQISFVDAPVEDLAVGSPIISLRKPVSTRTRTRPIPTRRPSSSPTTARRQTTKRPVKTHPPLDYEIETETETITSVRNPSSSSFTTQLSLLAEDQTVVNS